VVTPRVRTHLGREMPHREFSFPSPSKPDTVHIKISRSSVLKRPPEIEFYDPTDDTYWEEGSLSTKDTGRILQWTHIPASRLVAVHLPYRVACPEVWAGLKKLNTYKTLPPAVVLVPSLYTNFLSALQDFTLSPEQFTTFRQRMFDQYLWEAEELVYDAGAFFREAEALQRRLTDWLTDARNVRGIVLGLTPGADEGVIAATETNITELEAERVQLISGISDLQGRFAHALAALRLADRLQMKSSFDQIAALLGRVNAVNLINLQVEAIRQTELASSSRDQRMVADLAGELRVLAQSYPALRFLTVEADDVVLRLGSVEIRLKEQGLEVRGDVSTLKSLRIKSEIRPVADVNTARTRLASIKRRKRDGVNTPKG